MTGHRSALRAAVVAVIAAALITPAVPAQAQPDNLRLGGVGNVELKVGGGAQNVQLRVENRGITDAEQVSLTMTVPLTDLGVHIASAPGECELSNNNTRLDCLIPSIPANQAWSGVAQVAVHGNSSLQAGESRNGNGELTLNNFNQGREQFNVRLKGPDQAPSVAEVSGFVTDIDTGEPIEGARVTLVDSQGIDFTTTTNANGEFRFAGEQIAPGSLALKASKEGYQGRENIQQGQAGATVTEVQLTMTNTATPSPTPTPTATGTSTPTVAAAAPVEPTSSGLSFFTRLMIFLGVIFLLLGAAAIGYLIYRRRKEAQEFDDGDDGYAGADDPTSGPRGPQPSPGSRGVYHPTPTQIRGAGPATAVGPSAALANAETSLIPRAGADDATALHARSGGADETSLLPRAGGEPPGPRPPVPGSPPPPRSAAPTYGSGPRTQPYGSPVDPHSGAAPYRAGEYGAAPERGASEPDGPRHGAPDYDGGGYRGGYGGAGYRGDDAPGYAGSAGRGDPSAGYGPDPYARRDGHGASGYGGDAYQGYDSPTQHGSGYEPGAGYQEPGYESGRRSGYDQPGYQGGGYDQAGYRGGYDQPGHQGEYDQAGHRGGYEQGGYQQPGGYGQAGYDQSGYDRAGYDRSSYDQPGHDRAGYPPAGYDSPGYGEPGYGEPGYGQPGYGEPGYGEPGYDPRTDATGAYPRQPAPGADRRRPPDWRPE